MSKRCEDVTDRLLELLYDELPADERAALQAHIAGCARCQAEVASFQKTRSLARAALAEPVPAAVRQRLLAAAGAKPIAVNRGDDLKGRGLWAWLRQHWTLPTLGTIGAMAVFVLASRVFLNPDKTYRRGQEISAPASTPPPSSPSSPSPPKPIELRASRAEPKPEPAATSPAPAAPPPVVRRRRLGEDAVGRLSPLAGKDSAPSAGGTSGLGGIGQAPAGSASPHKMDAAKTEIRTEPRTKKSAVAKVVSSQQMQDLRENDKPNPFPGIKKEAFDSVDDKSDAPLDEARAMPKRKGGPAPTPPSPADQLVRRAQPAASAAAAPPPPKPAAPVAAAPPAAAAPAVVVAASPASARNRERTEEEAPAALEGLSSQNAAEGGKAAAEPLPQKAERLFAQQRWAEAAAAFEQLIRQYPQSPSVPRWRQRLAVARERAGPRAGH